MVKNNLMKIKIDNDIIIQIGKICDELGVNAYLVGGYVRDIVLGEKTTDIDIMITDDAISIAEKIAGRFGAKLSAVYKKFRTALLEVNGLKIEFASARKESYDRSSRKPKV